MGFHRVKRRPPLPDQTEISFGKFIRYGVAQIESIERLSNMMPNLSHVEFLAKSENLLKQFCIEAMEQTFGEGVDPDALDFDTCFIKTYDGYAIRVRCETLYNPKDNGYICQFADARKTDKKA